MDEIPDQQITALNILRDWLRDSNIEFTESRRYYYDDIHIIQGFGWALVIDSKKNTLEFSNRLNYNVAKLSMADPNFFDQFKLTIDQMEKAVIDYMVEHANDSWKPRKSSI